MAITEIKYFDWDLGNGEVSSEAEPITYYRPGVYDVSVTITLDDGSKVFLQELEYIICIGENDNLFQDGYLTDGKSYHFGFDESVSSGWSENSGDNWIWPESSAAISNQEINGVSQLLVWDLYDDKQYYINTKNTASSQVEYLDKGQYDIPGYAILRAERAASRSDVIKHIESTVKYSSDIDSGSMADGLQLKLSLITDPYGSEVETADIKNGIEVSFSEFSQSQFSESNMQQLKISTNKSEFNVEGIESLYRRTDQSRVTTDVPDTTAEDFFATKLANWSSTPLYSLDKWTGNAINIGTSSPSAGPIEGVSSLLTTQPVNIGNVEIPTGSLFFLYEGESPSLSVAYTDYGSIGSFTVAYFSGTIPANLTFPSGHVIFDVRIFDDAITTDVIDEYISNPKKFLPRS